MLDEGLKMHSGHPSLLAARSLALAESGKISEAIPLMITAVERDVNNVANLVHLARISTKKGKPREALQCLDMAVKMGGVSGGMLVNDPAFESIRNLPHFREILRAARHNINKARQE
jgi:hypothetical protein